MFCKSEAKSLFLLSAGATPRKTPEFNGILLHAVKRDPKGFEDIHGNKSAIVSFQDETIVSSISYNTYKILLLALTNS